MMRILKLFCHVDDFYQWLVTWESSKLLTRKRFVIETIVDQLKNIS